MRVTFTRLPDHEWGSVLIERDDHVVYRMGAGPITAQVPHDLVHYTVEDALRISDGIWGAIAAGVVFRSMTHVSGRRPPHAAERSAALIRTYRDRLQRAELLGGVVEAAAAGGELPARAGCWFPDESAVGRAVDALHAAEARWGALPIGGELTLTWPSHRRLPAAPTRRRH
ncbi:hypothetical protein [Cryptosporangium sp. NPDC051539]|uniref:hypothetical protein n=1 Tax=Cryptosporangium sp. NPDC051539 TaxID=3363962 RepID=UPI003793DD8B